MKASIAACALLLMAGCGGSPPADAGVDAGGVADLALPDLALPDLALPDLALPDLALPDLALPDLALPDLALPDLALPDLALPDLALPDLGVPDLGVPDAGVPGCVTEICNHIDDDCDGLVDEGVTVTCWVDADHDGYAAATATTVDDCYCDYGFTARPPGVSPDCDDTDPRRSPASAEVCNGVDDDCNGLVDEVTTASWYADCDGDLYGAGAATLTCTEPVAPPAVCPSGTWSSSARDCANADALRHPGAPELCNGIDDDCDSVVDGSAATAWCTSHAPPHVAYAACAGAACAVAACSPGYFDCDGGPDCELDCTTCGDACSWACGAPTCDGIVSMNVGNNHSCAVRASGRVYCWGQNSAGQLGDGTTTDRAVPTPVVGLTDAIEVVGGAIHTCALRRGGTVVCWGTNDMLQLGAPGPMLTAPGADVPMLSGVTHITAAEAHTCAVDVAGSVTCWGETLAPAVVAALPPVDAIDTGSTMTCAIRRADSVAVCWGRAALGDGTYYATSSPPVVVGGTTPLVVRDLGVGTITACAVDDVGQAWCWGANLNGMLGDGLTTHPGPSCGGVDCSLLPVQVTGITTATEVALGWHTGCVRLTSGQLECWGFNGAYCLGTGGSMTIVTFVPLLSGVADATSVAGKDFHFCAQRVAGGLSCWGLNLYGELGDGTTTVRTLPVTVLAP